MLIFLVQLLVFLLVFGFVLYLVDLLIGMFPLDAKVKQVARAIVLVIAVLYLLMWLMGYAPLLPPPLHWAR